jgi:hypothetical protein
MKRKSELQIDEREIPEIVRRRIEISKLFYPLERKLQRRLAKNLISGFDEISDYLNELAENRKYVQSVAENEYILWRDANSKSNECMFCLIKDISSLKPVTELFEKIKKYSPIFTYAFVHQKKDGDGVFDIFRFSKFSYLEHCNRVKYP